MRKALFTALGFNLFVEGLTSLRLITLPRRLDDFDPTSRWIGSLRIRSSRCCAKHFLVQKVRRQRVKFSYGTGSSLNVPCLHGDRLPYDFMPPGVVGHGLLAVAFVYLFIKRRACLPVAAQ